MGGVLAELARHHDRAAPGDGGAEEGDRFALCSTEQAAKLVGLDRKGAAPNFVGAPTAGREEFLKAADGERHHFQHLEGGCEGVECGCVRREVGDLAVEHPRSEAVREVADQPRPGDTRLRIEDVAADGAELIGAFGGFRGDIGPRGEEHGAAKARSGPAAGPERHLAHAGAELDRLHLRPGRHSLAVEPGRGLEHSGPGGREQIETGVPRGREGGRIEGAPGGVAPGGVEDDGEARQVQRGPSCVSEDDAGGRDVRAGKDRGGGVALDTGGWNAKFGTGTKVAAESAGEVGDGKAEVGEAPGAAFGDQWVGHHLQPGGGEEHAGVVAEAGSRLAAEGGLFGEGRGLGGRVDLAQGGDQPVRIVAAGVKREGGEGSPARRAHEVEGALGVHVTRVGQRGQRATCETRSMANIICLDFDDTIVLDNTARQIFERFAAPGWVELSERKARGELTVEQYNAAALDLVEATREEMMEFVVSVARPRAGFAELLDWAHWNGWMAVVVSNGYDFYVDAVLDHLGFDRVARHAGRTSKDYRWRVRYYSPRGVVLEDGFKVSYAAAFRAAGDFVVYVGDGESDVEAAKLAPVVFAQSTLLERLDGRHERLYAFETFDDVRKVLEREGAEWLESFSSTTAAEG